MDILYTLKREPYFFLYDFDVERYVSNSRNDIKFETNDVKEINSIKSDVHYLLDLFFMGKLPDTEYIYIIKLCNILNPDKYYQNNQYHYRNGHYFDDFHSYDYRMFNFHRRMIEVHDERKKFGEYLEWYFHTEESTKRIVEPDISGHRSNNRYLKIDFLRLLTEVLSYIFFKMTKNTYMTTVKTIIYKKLNFYFCDKNELNLLNNDLVDYLQELYRGIYDVMIEKMRFYDIDMYYRNYDVYNIEEVINKYCDKLKISRSKINFNMDDIKIETKNKIFVLIDSFLKGHNCSIQILYALNQLFNYTKYYGTIRFDKLEWYIYDFQIYENKKNKIINIFNKSNLPNIYNELFDYLNLNNKNEKFILGDVYFNFLFNVMAIFLNKLDKYDNNTEIYFFYILQKYIHFETLNHLKLIYSSHCFFQYQSTNSSLIIDYIRF